MKDSLAQTEESHLPTALGIDSARLGMWFFLATVTMLFAAFTSAYLVRSQGLDWTPAPLPKLLWLNTALILVSSWTLERSKRAGRAQTHWLLLSAVLGGLFLGGQLLAWSEMNRAGFYLQNNPHAAFFFTLTLVHALHLIGGTVLLGALAIKKGTNRRLEPRHLNVSACFWHFLAGLWIYILIVLTVL